MNFNKSLGRTVLEYHWVAGLVWHQRFNRDRSWKDPLASLPPLPVMGWQLLDYFIKHILEEMFIERFIGCANTACLFNLLSNILLTEVQFTLALFRQRAIRLLTDTLQTSTLHWKLLVSGHSPFNWRDSSVSPPPSVFVVAGSCLTELVENLEGDFRCMKNRAITPRVAPTMAPVRKRTLSARQKMCE